MKEAQKQDPTLDANTHLLFSRCLLHLHSAAWEVQTYPKHSVYSCCHSPRFFLLQEHLDCFSLQSPCSVCFSSRPLAESTATSPGSGWLLQVQLSKCHHQIPEFLQFKKLWIFSHHAGARDASEVVCVLHISLPFPLGNCLCLVQMSLRKVYQT